MLQFILGFATGSIGGYVAGQANAHPQTPMAPTSAPPILAPPAFTERDVAHALDRLDTRSAFDVNTPKALDLQDDVVSYGKRRYEEGQRGVLEVLGYDFDRLNRALNEQDGAMALRGAADLFRHIEEHFGLRLSETNRGGWEATPR